MRKLIISAFLAIISLPFYAQQSKELSITELIKMGLENSKQLKLDQAKIDKATAVLKETQDGSLPEAKVSLGYSHAYMTSDKFLLPGSEQPFQFKRNNDVFMNTLSVTQPLYTGNKLRYAKASAELLINVSKYSKENQQNEVIMELLKAYFNLYKIDHSKEIVSQNIQDIKGKLKQTKAFEKQGMATRNDVLRWQMQLSNVRLDSIDVANSREELNYTLVLLLGLPEGTEIQLSDSTLKTENPAALADFQNDALSNRNDLQAVKAQSSLADIKVKSAKSNMLPVLGASADLYYINPSSNFIPKQYEYLAPLTFGLNLSWNISSLYTTGHKVEEAKVMKQEAEAQSSQMEDHIKMQVQKAWLSYQKAEEKVKVLQVAIDQASENERILESKYKNNVASTTDRIDAETMLFSSKLQLELAKADAGLAYYELLKVSGKLNPNNIQ